MAIQGENLNAGIKGRAWIDVNGSGTQDAEAGKAGVTVELYNVANGALVSSMVTGADGTYSFAGLAAGDYTVRFVAADGTRISEQNLGDDELDSDINLQGETDIISLSEDQIVESVDAGFYPSASVGDRVWIDANANGVQDEGEAGKAGVTVELRLAADGGQGQLVATQVTDASGNYKFTGLDQGSYQIRFIANDGSVLSTANVGSDELDSDADGTTGLTGIFELTAGDDNTSVDAGFAQQQGNDNAVISGRAWVDANGSGTQDDPETGKAGVTVELYSVANGALVSSMVTGADGTYSFAGLAEGDYTVRFVAADGTLISERDLGDDELDSDINADGETDIINLGAGQVIDTVDAGFYPSASVGDRVWIDVNANGVQDDGEAGKAGVTVELRLAADGGQGTLVATTVTDANGNYKFIDLDQGSYQIRFIANDGSVLSTANVGSDELDSDADGAGLTGIFELTAGDDNTSVDAGFVSQQNNNAVISGRAWVDTNGSGTQDDPEAGKAGVTVELYNVANGALVSSMVTGADGTYSFAGLAEGDYTVRFVAADGSLISEQDLGDDELDSDINADGETDTISLGAGQVIDTVDAGFYPSASVGDRVWIDVNANGVQDEGEAGKAGVTVELRLAADGGQGTLVATTVTDANGNYKFIDLDQGSYQIRFIANDGSVLSTANVGSDELDSDADGTGLTGIFELTAGENDTTVDAGFVQTDNAVISGRAWVDTNGSGTQDDPEAGKAGVTVELYNVANGALVSSMVTGADGTYSFAGLAEGDYTVRFVAADGSLISEQDLGDDELDSDINADGETDTISLGAGQVIDTVDAGFYPSASVGDRVWIDANANGVQDEGEAGKAGVTVELLLAADGGQGTLVATTVTDANGNYKFIDLDQGSYQIRFIANDGSILSTANVGSDELDSDADGTGLTGIFELTAGENDTTVDAGFVQTDNAVISGRAWVDANGGGTQEPDEAGKAGVTVELYTVVNGQPGELVGSMLVNPDGTYSFAGLEAGDYTVRFVADDGSLVSVQDFGDDELDSDIKADGYTNTINLGVNQIIDTVDAGFYPTASVGDRVWIDENLNNVQDEGEVGKAGVTVELYLAGDGGLGRLVATQVTDANGNYQFTGLDQGSYQIRFINDDGSILSTADVGSDELDSDADGNGITGIFELTPGENDTSIDAGFQPSNKGSIGGRAWDDANGGGSQDPTETGRAGVTVELRTVDGALVGSMLTGADGTYNFTGLEAGDYFVRFVADDGLLISEQNFGDDGLDSDINADGVTNTISLGVNEVIDTVDAGFYPTASLGDRVWVDMDRDGVQDEGETGKANVTVELYTATDGGPGELVASTVTDANGNYLFEGLDQGSYQVKFIANDGAVLSTTDVGSDELDSDADGTTGLTGIYELTPGVVNTSVDAGYLFQPLTEVQVCEDTSKVFSVLEGYGPGAKLVGVSHETAELDSLFVQRGGAINFTEEGQIAYTSMTNYYGFDKLVYTVEDATGKQYTQTVDVTVKAVSDGAVVPTELTYVGYADGYSESHNINGWAYNVYHFGLGDFAEFSDAADELQQFGGYNVNVENDVDELKDIVIHLTPQLEANLRYDVGDTLGQTLGEYGGVLSAEDVEAGKLGFWLNAYNHAPYFISYHYVDTGSVDNEACYDGTVDSNTGTTYMHTPIALDLNGDGQIGVTGATSSHQKDADAEIGRTVQFDIDADGTLDVIEWYDGSGDGILIDNRDGQAATDMDGARLFGDQGGQYADGYAKLATLDANGDGQLSGQELEGVELWLDNGDAIVQDGEIQTLAAHGIAAISTEVSIVLDAQGKEHLQSSATRGDGSTVMSEDVFFLEDVLAGDNLDALVGPGAAAATAAPLELGNDAAATDSAQAELLRQLSAQMESQAIAA